MDARNFERAPLFSGSSYDFVAIAASAGGFVAIRHLVSVLPRFFPVPVAVVLHLSRFVPSRAADLVGARGGLPVKFAEQGERLRAGHVYVAPPDRHLGVDGEGHVSLSSGPRLNYVRPAADHLFASAAEAFGSRVLGVVLTGMGRDGADGARLLRACGGSVLAQDPGSAEAPSMPQAAIDAGAVDLVLPLRTLGSALTSLVTVRGVNALFNIPRVAA